MGDDIKPLPVRAGGICLVPTSSRATFIFKVAVMARPERKDVDYFPFYVKNGRTLQLLEGKYDCKGTGFFTNLLRFLSGRPLNENKYAIHLVDYGLT